jgi:hypothetical protein
MNSFKFPVTKMAFWEEATTEPSTVRDRNNGLRGSGAFIEEHRPPWRARISLEATGLVV